jgi:hypothetical protein
MSTLQVLHTEKAEIEAQIAAKKKEIETWEPDIDDYEDQYCDAIDEQGDIVICGMKYSPSATLEVIDPTAYRCGLIDYVDGLELTPPEELEGELFDLKVILTIKLTKLKMHKQIPQSMSKNRGS